MPETKDNSWKEIKGLEEKKRLPLELTGMELVYLIDQVKNIDIAEGLPDAEARIPIARELLLRMGSLYTELVTVDGVKPGPLTIYITEDDAWLLRGKTQFGATGPDKKDVGTMLLVKLYALLLDFHGLEIEDIHVEGPSMTPEHRAKLNQWHYDRYTEGTI